MQAIVICTVANPGITILLESIRVYAPTVPVYIYSVDSARGERFKRILPNATVRPNLGRNFGDSYNNAIDITFSEMGIDSLILANDDVVLNPQTIELLGKDKQILEENQQVIIIKQRFLALVFCVFIADFLYLFSPLHKMRVFII